MQDEIQHTPEQWRPVIGHEGAYEASDHGRVRSIDRYVQYELQSGTVVRARRNGRILRPGTKKSGHQYVSLADTTHSVHVIVLTAFAGPCPPGMECRHINGNASDNRPENLRWGTLSENELDKVRHGTHHNANKTRCKHGHHFTPENVILDSNKSGGVSRRCRTCHYNRVRSYQKRKKESQRA